MSEEVVAKLFDIIEKLIAQNEILLTLVSRLSDNDTETEFEQQVEIPQPQKTMGKLPWEMRKAKLEELHKKRKVRELTGIPDATASEEDNNEEVG